MVLSPRAQTLLAALAEGRVTDALAIAYADPTTSLDELEQHDGLARPLVNVLDALAYAPVRTGEALQVVRYARVVSFMTNHVGSTQGEIVLGGVNPKYRGHNAYEGLVGISERHFLDHGVMQSVISTQTTNRTVIRTWIRNGYQLDSAYATLHLVKGRALHELDACNERADAPRYAATR